MTATADWSCTPRSWPPTRPRSFRSPGARASSSRSPAGRGAVKEESSLFAEAAAQGQSIIVASGDNGSASCTGQNFGNGLSVQDPSSQPNVTAVGASSLYTTNAQGGVAAWAPGDPWIKGVWNDGIDPSIAASPWGSTGGLSTIWAMPSYQAAAAAGLGVVNPLTYTASCGGAHCREVPDVSANGDPGTGYVVYDNGAWDVIGGTSASTPVWGALTALANALPACRGLTLGFENPSIYRLAGLNYAGYFHDVTTGTGSAPANNDALGLNGGLYPVSAGYDLDTGLGDPNAAALASGLCALRAPVVHGHGPESGHRHGGPAHHLQADDPRPGLRRRRAHLRRLGVAARPRDEGRHHLRPADQGRHLPGHRHRPRQ